MGKKVWRFFLKDDGDKLTYKSAYLVVDYREYEYIDSNRKVKTS